jgi:hypothetical protein
MGYLGAGKRNGRKEEKKEEDLAREAVNFSVSIDEKSFW